VADQSSQPPKKRVAHTDAQILLFIVILCFTCAFLLSVVAYVLHTPQEEAKAFDQSKQMLIAAKILTYDDYFEIFKDGKTLPALFNLQQKLLVPVEKGEKAPKATADQIKEIADELIRPLVTDKDGNVYSLEDKGLTLPQYLAENKKAGYANLPLKLFYAILPNDPKAKGITASDLSKDLSQVAAYVIPVSGFGLWGPIYGYIALGPDGDEVIGTTWYEQGETPGLGANISEPTWQKQFFGKLVFQESPEGTTDFKTTGMGIIVVKGKVIDVYGDTPKSKSAVDGISGATLTGDGVTAAYHDSLTPYRAFHYDSSN